VIGRLHEVVIDCADPGALARFWQVVLTIILPLADPSAS
jgi:hypothetical protein